MKRSSNDVTMMLRGGLFGLLLFSSMAVNSVVLADELHPPAIGRTPQRAKSKWTDDQLYGPYKGKSLKSLWSARDEFFKSGRVPTDSNEVQRLWQWHRAMDNADPAFGSKMPIEFYGKAVDQYGKPVPSATVDMYWGKGTNQIMQTLLDGSFVLSGVTGSSLSVHIYKNGYDTGRQSYGAYNYADFFDHYFHLPNPTNPVIFRLQKLENPEPMYVWSGSAKLDVTGTVVWIDVGTGEKGASGDIGFSVVRDVFPGGLTTGYTLDVLTPPAGGVVITNEEFMFNAPESGYSSRETIQHRPSGLNDQRFDPNMKFKLYLKTTDAKYAAIEVVAAQRKVPEAYMQLVIMFNPSGSRNLEIGPIRLDPKKAKALRGTAKKGTGSEDKRRP